MPREVSEINEMRDGWYNREMQETLDFANQLAEAVKLSVDGRFVTFSARRVNPGRWHEIAACDLVTGAGTRWRLSVREMRHSIPAHCVDYLSVEDPESDSHLLIVYLCSESAGMEMLPAELILSNRWASVTHVYWGDGHPYSIIEPLQPRPRLPAGTGIRQEGGKRVEGSVRRSSEEEPLVSVMTVVFNGEETIEQTIQSVLHQDYPNIEYLIVDGASRDGTLDVVNRYGAYIDYWKSEPDKGWLDGFNKGVELASGDLIGAIHANDLYRLDTVSTVMAHARRYPDGEFYYGNLEYVAEDDSWLRGAEIRRTWEMVMFGDFFHPTCFVRPRIYSNHGGLNLDYPIAADYDMGVRYWKAGVKFSYIDAALGYFRLGGISSNLWANQWERHLVRIANGENAMWSLFILLMVVTNYYTKGALRGIARFVGLSK